MKKIKETFNRKSLVEGRTSGVSVAFIDKETKEVKHFGGEEVRKAIISNRYVTKMPLSACKDYCNDFIYGEQNKTDLSRVYGYSHKFTNYLKGKTKVLLVVTYLPDKSFNIKEPLSLNYFLDRYSIFSTNFNNFVDLMNSVARNLTGIKEKVTVYSELINTTYEQKYNEEGFTQFPCAILSVPLSFISNPFLFSAILHFSRQYYTKTRSYSSLKRIITDSFLKGTVAMDAKELWFINSPKKLQKELVNKYTFPKTLKEGHQVHNYGFMWAIGKYLAENNINIYDYKNKFLQKI